MMIFQLTFTIIIIFLLLLIGYNLIFYTEKTIKFFDKHAKPSENTLRFRKELLGKQPNIWYKINGYLVVVFAIILIICVIKLIINEF